MKTKRTAIIALAALLLATALTACGSGNSTVPERSSRSDAEVQTEAATEPETEPETEPDTSAQLAESIRSLIAAGKWQEASQEIDSLEYTDITAAEELRSYLESEVTAEADTRVEQYFANFDYDGAYSYLSELYSELDLESIYNRQKGLEDTFVIYALDTAEQDASDRNYVAASAVIQQAMDAIGGENETLKTAYDDYRSHLPVYITEMDCMALRGELTINDTLVDNVGNTYHNSYSINGSGYSSADGTWQYWADYFINGKYTTFSGTIALPPNYKDSDESKFFEIYGDGELLYTSPTVTNTFLPSPFTVDVTGVTVLRIYYSDAGGNNRIATIFDGLLTPAESD